MSDLRVREIGAGVALVMICQAIATCAFYRMRAIDTASIVRSDVVVFALPTLVGFAVIVLLLSMLRQPWLSVPIRLLLSVITAGVALLGALLFALNRWGA